MKLKILPLIVVVCCILSSCEDPANDLEMLVQPSKDKVAVTIDSFLVHTSTLFVDSTYARSTKFVLGTYTDPVFGTVKGDFMSQFKYVKNYAFPTPNDSTAKDIAADSLFVVLYYKNFMGDSLSTQEVTIYKLNELFDFEKNYYSNIDVSKFCDKQTILGSKVYTAADQTIPDSIRYDSDYVPRVKVLLSNELRDEFFSRQDIYTSQSSFVNFFKGIYATNQYGNGTVLLIDSANIELAYHYTDTVTYDNDSTIRKTVIYPSNKEVTGVNCISHPNNLRTEISLNDSVEYVSSPAGLFPKITIPFDRILSKMSKEQLLNINNAQLIVEEAIFDDYKGEYEAPSYLLLLREKDLNKFFAQSLYPATSIGIYSFLGTYDSDENKYSFASMANYLQSVLQKDETTIGELNDFVLVPVKVSTDSNSNTTIKPLFSPKGVRLRSGKNTKSSMRLEITSSKF